MERNEANLGKKFEPAFAPEWLKTTSSSSSPSDDHGTESTPRSARNPASYWRSYTTNGFHHQEREIHSDQDNINSGVLERDTLRRSQSMISRGNSAWSKKSGIEAVSTSIGVVKASFDREFPHLGTEDNINKPGLSETVKFQRMPFYSSAVVGGDGWNSVLAEMPETFLARNSLKVSDDSAKLEELEVKVSRQLIPKTSANFAEKVKSKGSRAVALKVKVGPQLPAQHGPNNYRGLSRPDTPKTPKTGNFQVLNREKNGISPPPARDAVISTGVQRPPSMVNGPIKSPRPITTNDKRPVSHQNRSDFFNSLRKKASENATLTVPEKSNSVSGQPQELVDSCSESSSGSVKSEGNESSSPSWVFDTAEEERLLRLFGWKEDAGEGEGGLTAAEIYAFIVEFEKRRPSSDYCHRSLLVAKMMLTEMGGSH